MCSASWLGQGLTDKVTSVAWHPTKPQLLAFGCDSGAVGSADVASGVATAFTVRHKVRCSLAHGLGSAYAAQLQTT
jgi:hypothetical protein